MTKLLDQAIERLRQASKDHWIDDVEAQLVPRLLADARVPDAPRLVRPPSYAQLRHNPFAFTRNADITLAS
jgi:hypothetical protein